MKLLKYSAFAALMLSSAYSFAQDNSVGINTNSPNANAVLELVSPNSNQGFLVPRVTSSQRTSMSLTNQDNGLMVFDTDFDLFYYWNNGSWKAGLGVLNVTTAGGDLTGNYPNPIIRAGAVNEGKLADFSVSTAKLQNSSVTTGKINNGAVTTDKIANEAVTGAKLEDVGITPNTYGNQFTVLQLTADSKGRIIGISEIPILITSTHITNLSVLNEDIANGTITISKLNAEGNSNTVLTVDGSGNPVWTDRSEFTSSTLAQNNIYVGNSSGVAQGLPVSGASDITVTNGGTTADLQIRPNAVTTSEILNNTITTDDIATDGVAQDEIAPNSVGTSELINLNVTNAKIANDAITSEKILNREVETLDIATGAVTENELADNAVTAAKIADDNVTRNEINADVAGLGLVQNVDGSLEINEGNGLQISGDILSVNLGDLAGDGIVEDAVNQEFDINVDNATLEVSGDILQVMNLGITTNKLADRSVTQGKILPANSNAILISNNVPDAAWFSPGVNQIVVTGAGGAITSRPVTDFATKDLNLGSIFVGDASNQAQQLFAGQANYMLVGNGSTVVSAPISGDIAFALGGPNIVSTIQNNAVDGTDLDLTTDFVVPGSGQFILNNTNGLRVNNATDLNGTLDVAGQTNLAAAGTNTTVRGDLAVDEAADFNSSVNIDGTATANNGLDVTA
ncbi:beta strand repeat-containing protein, partial [Ekhidna sp.]|uniref:beta strand repeat-containing protein n=1 Tax=Ekhidna sp. TaxID=2608089 RepID=UPI0035159D38